MEKSYNAIVCRYDLTLIKMAIEIDSMLEYNFGANFENQTENLSISVRIIRQFFFYFLVCGSSDPNFCI